MGKKRSVLKIVFSAENVCVRIIEGWGTAFDAQRMFLAMCQTALAKRVERMSVLPLEDGKDPEHRLAFQMQMKTAGYASFTSESLTIRECLMGGGWCGYGFEFHIKGDKALEIVHEAAKLLRWKVEERREGGVH